jgi:electron transport complex protein RnfD
LPAADAVSSATYLGIVSTGAAASEGATGGPLSLLEQAGFARSATDLSVTSWINANILGPIGVELPNGYVDPFLGNIPGCIGEVSAALLLLGTIYLFARKIITWEIPTAYFGIFALLTWAFGGYPHGSGAWSGDVLFHVRTGGFILGVFYMATDMVTSPMTRTGLLIYGAGAGLLTFVIRTYGSFPEGVSLAIILMNIFVPLINRATQPRRFGVRKQQEAEA